MYKFIEGSMGEGAEHLARFGAAGLVGIDLRGSLRPRIDVPENAWDILGAPGGAALDVKDAYTNIMNGDELKGLEKLAPRHIAGKIKAYREYTDGITTKGNAPVMYKGEHLRPSLYDAAVRFTSGNPTGLSGPREELWKKSLSDRHWADKRSAIYSRMRKWVNDGRPSSKWKALQKEVDAYNKAAKKKEEITLISESTIKRVLKGADPELLGPQEEETSVNIGGGGIKRPGASSRRRPTRQRSRRTY